MIQNGEVDLGLPGSVSCSSRKQCNMVLLINFSSPILKLPCFLDPTAQRWFQNFTVSITGNRFLISSLNVFMDSLYLFVFVTQHCPLVLKALFTHVYSLIYLWSAIIVPLNFAC